MQSRIIGKAYGKDVLAYTLKDDKIEVEIMTLGATITSIKTQGKNGLVDVVLGYNTAEEYLADTKTYFGATIGRVCNRVENSKFELNGKTYNVGDNNNGNSLHGGIQGFDKKIWQDKVVGDSLYLTYLSVDGEEGYPANLTTSVKFTVQDGGLIIDYTATADGDTPINLTNHAYFNLNGENSGSILDTELTIFADKITTIDKNLVARGFTDVEGTPFDFNTPKLIGKDINADHELLKNGGGYDVNYVIRGKGLRLAAIAENKTSQIKMQVFTDNYGLQFYSGNVLDVKKGKNSSYSKNEAFCLETQNFPNALNVKEYPSPFIKKGDIYKTTTIYKFI